MNKIKTFREIIELWPSRIAFALAIGVTRNHAGNMYARDAIDAKYFTKVVEAAQAIGRTDVTYQLLCEIAARKGKPADSGGGEAQNG